MEVFKLQKFKLKYGQKFTLNSINNLFSYFSSCAGVSTPSAISDSSSHWSVPIPRAATAAAAAIKNSCLFQNGYDKLLRPVSNLTTVFYRNLNSVLIERSIPLFTCVTIIDETYPYSEFFGYYMKCSSEGYFNMLKSQYH